MSINGMDVGVFIFATDYTIRMDELARELESRGYESLFLPEHTHIPTSRKTPWDGGGGDLPRDYWHTHDPFVALSYAAAATSKLKVGTGICLLPQRETFVTAKSVASLDMMSGGRFILGLGGGWNVEEMNDHGVEYKTRFKLMRERVLAMKRLWTEDEGSFRGEMISFDSAWAWPKPVQKPHPPILLGGESDYTLNRVVEYCDGWFPRVRPGFDPLEGMNRLRQAAVKAGRDPASLSLSLFRAKPDRAELEAYAEARVSRAVLQLWSTDRDDVIRQLDAYAPLLAT